MKKALLALGASVAITTGLVSGAAVAGVYTVSASGTWATGDAAPPTTPYSVPGESFSFSFKLPTTFTYVTTEGVDSVYPSVAATELTSFSYSLNGSPLSTTTSTLGCSGTGVLCGVEFFPSGAGGGLALDFGDYSIEMSGAQIFSSGTLTTGTGSYDPNINYNDNLNQGMGIMSVSVPEPATWALMLSGVAFVGGALRSTRRTNSAA
jgi:hypothetical protein